MTKFTKILVAVAMLWLAVVHATPLMAQRNYDFQVGRLYYKITNGARREVAVVPEISYYPYYNNRPTGAISIPATVVNGSNYRFSVTSIGFDAFYGCSGLTSIYIPSSVTSIRVVAFKGCSGLTSITIPNSVTSIGKSAFEGCSGLTSITLPNGITKIENGTFYNCTSLASVNLPSGLDSIGSSNFNSWDEGVFEGCTSLTSINIPNSVKFIGKKTFSDCSGLSSINIPSSVTWIEQWAFKGCSGLTAVAVGWQTPLYVAPGVFDGVTLGRVKLIVPFGKRNIYQTANVWKDFNPIVERAPMNYTVTYSQSLNGTFKLKNGLQDIVSGSSVQENTMLTVEATPNIGYQVDSIKVNGIRITGVSFMVQGNTTVEVFWGEAEYLVTYNQSVGGTLTVKDGTQTIVSGGSVEHGTVLTVEATPAQGYKLDSIKVNGIRISGLSFTVNSNSTVEAYFSKMKYTITYTQPANGTLTLKDGTQTIVAGDSVEYGMVLTVEATPYQGYKLDSIRVNGARISGFSFTVDSNSTIEAYFSKMKYTVTYTQPANGTLTLKNGSQTIFSGDSVEHGTMLTIEATPAQGYRLDSVRVNGVRISGLSFTVTSSSVVEVYFSKPLFTISYNLSAGGTFKVKNGSQEVASGSSIEYGTVLTFEATAAEHYKFDSIRVNGARISGLSFTVTDNTNIEVFFGKQSYTVTYNSNMYSGKIEVTRGSEIVASGSSVEYGTQLMVRAIPNHGFEVKSLTINDQAIANDFVFSISESVEIKAVFAPATTALDEAATKPLAIYPNPVAEVLYLSATARTIRIYDMYGTEVAHATDTDKVEVSHLPAGVYTVRADGMVAKMVKR